MYREEEASATPDAGSMGVGPDQGQEFALKLAGNLTFRRLEARRSGNPAARGGGAARTKLYAGGYFCNLDAALSSSWIAR